MGSTAECLFPHRRCRSGVDEVARGVDGPPGGLVVLTEGPGAVAHRWRTVGRHVLESPDDVGKIERAGRGVPDPVEGGAFAGYPAMDRPPIGIALPGFTDGDGLGHGNWEVWRQSGQPRRLHLDLICRPVDAGQARDQVVSQPPEWRVGAPRLHLGQRSIGETGQLRREEASDETLAHVDLLGVRADLHRLSSSGPSPRRARQAPVARPRWRSAR